MLKEYKILILIMVMIMLFSSCSTNNYSHNNTYSEESNIEDAVDTVDNVVDGSIVTDDVVEPPQSTEAEITPITTNPFIEAFRDPEQRIERTYTAPETGVYRFDLSFDNANSAISFYMEDKEKNEIVSNKYIENKQGFNVSLKKGMKYFITLKAQKECPTVTINIRVPHSTVTLSSDVYHDEITYIGQENTYKYTAPRDGIYRFDVNPKYVTFNYRMIVTAPDKSELGNQYLDGKNGITVTLEANKCYSIFIIQEKDFASYDINIGIPDEPKTAPQKTIKGTLEYTDNVDTYILTVPTSGRYKFIFDISDVNSYYAIEIYDTKNKSIYSNEYIRQNTYIIELKANMQYELNIVQKRGTCDYQIDYFPYYEDE